MTIAERDVFWERIAYGVAVSQRDRIQDDEADMLRYVVAQHEPAMPRSQAWNIEVLI